METVYDIAREAIALLERAETGERFACSPSQLRERLHTAAAATPFRVGDAVVLPVYQTPGRRCAVVVAVHAGEGSVYYSVRRDDGIELTCSPYELEPRFGVVDRDQPHRPEDLAYQVADMIAADLLDAKPHAAADAAGGVGNASDASEKAAAALDALSARVLAVVLLSYRPDLFPLRTVDAAG